MGVFCFGGGGGGFDDDGEAPPPQPPIRASMPMLQRSSPLSNIIPGRPKIFRTTVSSIAFYKPCLPKFHSQEKNLRRIFRWVGLDQLRSGANCRFASASLRSTAARRTLLVDHGAEQPAYFPAPPQGRSIVIAVGCVIVAAGRERFSQSPGSARFLIAEILRNKVIGNPFHAVSYS